MAHVVKDRVMETTSTTGTGTITLGGAVTGYQDFSVIGNGNTTYYAILGGSEWEVGIGTYTASGTTLSRDTVLESSNSGSLVNFSAGTKNVICTYPAEKSVYQDGSYSNPAWITSLDDSKVLPSMSGKSGKFLTNNGTDSSWGDLIPSGTVMLFVQSTAPTGWTQVVSDTADNRMLRVVKTAGGNVGGSHSPILNNVVPSHTHGFTTGNQSADHSHSGWTGGINNNHVHQQYVTANPNTGGTGIRRDWAGDATGMTKYDQGIQTGTVSSDHAHYITTGGVSANHTHSGSTDNGSSQTNWTPRYVDVIVCSKD